MNKTTPFPFIYILLQKTWTENVVLYIKYYLRILNNKNWPPRIRFSAEQKRHISIILRGTCGIKPTQSPVIPFLEIQISKYVHNDFRNVCFKLDN